MSTDDEKLKLIAGLLLRQLTVHGNAPAWIQEMPPMAHWENAKRKDPKYLEGFMRDAAEILAELEKSDAGR